MRRLPLLGLPLILSLVSCIGSEPEVLSPDCTGPVPAQFTRIYIGVPARGGQQSGISDLDPLDGTTADKFDTILRTIAESQGPTWGTQSQIQPENLIVCIGRGVFQTQGQYDWLIHLGHTKGATNTGFTVERNWRIHGHGTRHTVLRLASVMTDQFAQPDGSVLAGGHNVVLGTHSDNASGVEVSDLTIDANHDNLNNSTGLPLNLSAIVLRSTQGGHWIHNVNVVGASGDLGAVSSPLENFPIFIWGESRDGAPSQSHGNVIERVNLTRPGGPVGKDQLPGAGISGIVVANAGAEIRNNLVEGYAIAYGGWSMGPMVWFHDNVARNTRYGFNVDSFTNLGVVFESNQIIHPAAYGIVIGGSDPRQRFSGWKVLNNTIELDSSGTVGIVLRGQVQGIMFSGNTIISDRPDLEHADAIWSYPSGTGVANFGNIYDNNQFDSSLRMDFSQDPDFNANCRFQNRDLQNRPRADFPDNSGGPSGCSTVATPFP